MTTQHLPMEALVLGPDEGTHLHFLNHLATIKVAGEAGSMNVVEFLAPGGFGPPLHSHRNEDELFVILEGEVSVRSGDIEGLAGRGSCVFLPSGRPHTFQNLSESWRIGDSNQPHGHACDLRPDGHGTRRPHVQPRHPGTEADRS